MEFLICENHFNLWKRIHWSPLQLHAVIVSKPGLGVEFLAFAPGGRPAVFWTRSLAEGWLEELRRQRVIADGRVEKVASSTRVGR
jgi:hypothetical protein